MFHHFYGALFACKVYMPLSESSKLSKTIWSDFKLTIYLQQTQIRISCESNKLSGYINCTSKGTKFISLLSFIILSLSLGAKTNLPNKNKIGDKTVTNLIHMAKDNVTWDFFQEHLNESPLLRLHH